MNQHINNMVEMVYEISKIIPDQVYMNLMSELQKIYMVNNNNTEHNEFELLYYQLQKKHNRLKKDNRRNFKKRKEQFEAMEQTIEALQHEVMYLEQHRPKQLTINDFVDNETILV